MSIESSKWLCTPTFSQNWKKKVDFTSWYCPFCDIEWILTRHCNANWLTPKHNAFCKKSVPKPMHFELTYPSINFALYLRVGDGAWYLGSLRCTFSMGGVVGKCCEHIQHNLLQGPILKALWNKWPFVFTHIFCPLFLCLAIPLFFNHHSIWGSLSIIHSSISIHYSIYYEGPFSPLPIFWTLHNLANIFPSCLFTFIANTTRIICPTLLFLLFSIILLPNWFWWG